MFASTGEGSRGVPEEGEPNRDERSNRQYDSEVEEEIDSELRAAFELAVREKEEDERADDGEWKGNMWCTARGVRVPDDAHELYELAMAVVRSIQLPLPDTDTPQHRGSLDGWNGFGARFATAAETVSPLCPDPGPLALADQGYTELERPPAVLMQTLGPVGRAEVEGATGVDEGLVAAREMLERARFLDPGHEPSARALGYVSYSLGDRETVRKNLAFAQRLWDREGGGSNPCLAYGRQLSKQVMAERAEALEALAGPKPANPKPRAPSPETPTPSPQPLCRNP